MIAWRRVFTGLCAFGAIVAGSMVLPSSTLSQDTADEPKKRIEVHLTESFYRALRAEDGKTYTTSTSDEYLRQIAVSTRFAVETNLRIIDQQSRIIALLESGRGK